MGLGISVLVVSFGGRFLDFSSELFDTHPNIDAAFPDTRFEFPDRLEATDPARVGARPSDQNVSNAPHGATGTVEPDGEVATTDGGDQLAGTDNEGRVVTGYVLQVGAFSNQRTAEALRAELLIWGYNAYTTEHPDEGTETPFRVIIGPYDSESESQEDIEGLRQRNISAFLVVMTEASP